MKKIISVLLCFVMIISCAGFSYPQAEAEQTASEIARAYDDDWNQKVVDIQAFIQSNTFTFAETIAMLHQEQHFNDAFYWLGADVRQTLYEKCSVEQLYELQLYVKYSLVQETIYFYELQKTEDLKRRDVYTLASYYDSYVEVVQCNTNEISPESKTSVETAVVQFLTGNKDLSSAEAYEITLQATTDLNLTELITKLIALDADSRTVNLMDIQVFKNYLYTLFGYSTIAEEAERELSIMASQPMALAAGTVTGYTKITWGLSTGKYEVNGIQAFCCEYQKTYPLVNSTIDSINLTTNEIMRKALYYGYNGPGNVLGSDDKAFVLTSIALSDANIGEDATGVKATYDEFYHDLVNNPSKYPSPPSNFKAYIAVTASTSVQDLAFYQIDPTGYVKVSKSSTNPELTNGNSCYSLAGAVYTLYSNAACTSAVGTLTTDATGNTGSLSVNAGTYYLKETTAPKGYSISDQVHTVTITANNTTTVYATNKPQTDPVGVLLGKIDKETNANKPQGSASLEGAQFIVKFYARLWDANVDPATLGQTPIRTWVFETDSDGFCEYDNAYLVDGDELILSPGGYPSLPIGTVTIQETKAPEGYLINHEVFVRQITSSGNADSVFTYNEPIIPEQIFEVQLTKYQAGTDIPIPNVVFEHTKPNGSVETLSTDESGKLSFKGLEYGSHAVKEVSVMDGYLLNENVITFTVNEDNSVVNTSEFDSDKGDVVFEITDDGNIRLYVYDNVDPYDLVVHKKNDMGTFIAGAEFTLFAESTCETEVMKGVSGQDGELRLEGLSPERKYYLKETKAPAGYRIPVDENGNPYVYEVYASSTPVKDEFILYVNGVAYTETEGTFFISGPVTDREAHMTLVNDVGMVLPHTGSSGTVLFIVVGSVLCCSSLLLGRRKSRYE